LEGIPSNVIVRSLGPEPLVQVDLEGPHPIEPGDVFILCSDGLSGPVSDSEIGAVATVLPPAEACRFLIDLANVRGGPDNITSLIVRVKDKAQLKRTIQKTRAQHIRSYIWPVCLMAAVCLASYALVLKSNQSDGLAMLIFTLAAITALGGMAAFFANYQRE